ncbi:Vegetative incompatibility protein HET-E-1 [Cladobotryum mycophilum]|uniref:Vegetative incompatibility protein HET-E-1 n=1 Tax=Cladobotryum mycophilum TaxID=491253 RepID=A0ABR0T2I5_9HYPO
MRLINTRSLELEEFYGDDIPRYAILSHTWGSEEATLQGWQNRHDSALTEDGYAKIHMARGQALNDGIEYLWVDTVCIDKSSLAEVSEAINSMFWWYRDAYVCYAHLSDVGDSEDTMVDMTEMMYEFSDSRWFRRGWTLQELLAPGRVVFYSKFWTKLGTKHNMANDVARITGIEETYLLGMELSRASVAKRMSWMSQRHTTRPEDQAYCMMGIFDINMPLLYGEGRKAFMRLQAEIMKQSVDETLFCWSWDEATPSDWVNLLAPSPSNFSHSGKYEESPGLHSSYSLTNLGINISLSLTTLWTHYVAVLNVQAPDGSPVGIALAGYPEKGIFWRTNFPPGPVELPLKGLESANAGGVAFRKNVLVLSRMPKAALNLVRPVSWETPPFKYAIMIAFSDKTLQQSTRRRGIHGAIIRLKVSSRIEMRFLFAINASGRPCWYFVDLTPSSSRSLDVVETTGQEELERHLDTLSVQHAVRGTRHVQKTDYAVSIGRALKMPHGGVLRLVHIRTGKCVDVNGLKA